MLSFSQTILKDLTLIANHRRQMRSGHIPGQGFMKLGLPKMLGAQRRCRLPNRLADARIPTHAKITRGFKIAAIGILGVMALMDPALLIGAEVVETGVITASKLNMRSAPDPTARILMVLNRDTRVQIIRRESEWLQIWHHDTIGYIRNREQYVRIMTAAQAKIAENEKSFPPAAEKKERFEIQSQEIRQKLSEHRQEVTAFTQQEVALVKSLDDIDLSIDSARKELAAFRRQIDILDGKTNETTAAIRDLVVKIKQIEAYAAKRLVALYKLNWLGRLNVLASAENMHDLFQRKFALEKILSHDDDIRQELIASTTRLELLQRQLHDEKNAKLSLETKSREQIGLMSKKRAERSRLLAEIRTKKSMGLAAIEALKQSAQALDQQMRLLGTAEKRPLRKEKEPAQSFNELKGLLKIPVKGTIITSFGSYLSTPFNVVNFRSGIDIKAERGEPIRAVGSGGVIYANWFRGYGNMIIIDHGDSYYTVYAHVEEFFKSQGDMVESDEVIATAGDTGSIMGSGLYFEVRHHGKPLDPMEWIKRG